VGKLLGEAEEVARAAPAAFFLADAAAAGLAGVGQYAPEAAGRGGDEGTHPPQPPRWRRAADQADRQVAEPPANPPPPRPAAETEKTSGSGDAIMAQVMPEKHIKVHVPFSSAPSGRKKRNARTLAILNASKTS
jgi:hypothetical protein